MLDNNIIRRLKIDHDGGGDASQPLSSPLPPPAGDTRGIDGGCDDDDYNIMVVNEVTDSAVVNGAYDVMTNHKKDLTKEPKAVHYDRKQILELP